MRVLGGCNTFDVISLFYGFVYKRVYLFSSWFIGMSNRLSSPVISKLVQMYILFALLKTAISHLVIHLIR